MEFSYSKAKALTHAVPAVVAHAGEVSGSVFFGPFEGDRYPALSKNRALLLRVRERPVYAF